MRVEIEIGAAQLQDKSAEELLNLIGESVLALQNKKIAEKFVDVFYKVKETYDTRRNFPPTLPFSATKEEIESSAKIAAVKHLRELTGFGLRLSKFTVEGWIASNWV
jgi:ribosomal protein L7/L12